MTRPMNANDRLRAVAGQRSFFGALTSASSRSGVGTPRASSAPQTLGKAPTLGVGGFGDDCKSDSDCNSDNCLLGVCAPGISSANPVNLFCGPNSHADGFSCVCDVGFVLHPTGECVPQEAQTGGLSKAACEMKGGIWSESAQMCGCPPGVAMQPDGTCSGVDSCFGVAEGASCTDPSGNHGKCLGGNCVNACVDDLGNEGHWSKDDQCVGTACGQGQGRSEDYEYCMACAYGFAADGIHCRSCPKGLHAVGDNCECDAPNVFDANWNCVKPGTAQPPTQPKPPPPTCASDETLVGEKCVKVPATVKCDPRTQEPGTDANGAPTCKPKAAPNTPDKEKGGDSGNGLLIGLAAIALAVGVGVAVTAKKKKRA